MNLTMRLLSLFPHEDIGWKDIGETFIRYDLIKTRWFNLYLHNLIAEKLHTQRHTHPWWFVAFILKGGYNEFTEATGWIWRSPGTLLFRTASWAHNVTTDSFGMWSLVLTGPKKHSWGFID
jgi:hypothetical protein